MPAGPAPARPAARPSTEIKSDAVRDLGHRCDPLHSRVRSAGRGSAERLDRSCPSSTRRRSDYSGARAIKLSTDFTDSTDYGRTRTGPSGRRRGRAPRSRELGPGYCSLDLDARSRRHRRAKPGVAGPACLAPRTIRVIRVIRGCLFHGRRDAAVDVIAQCFPRAAEREIVPGDLVEIELANLKALVINGELTGNHRRRVDHDDR